MSLEEQNKQENRAVPFYEGNDPYTVEYKSSNGLSGDVKAIYNPIPKIVDTIVKLTSPNKLKITEKNKEESPAIDILQQISNYNNFDNQLKGEILRSCLLKSKAYIEVLRKKDGTFSIKIHEPSKIEIKKFEGEIIYAKLSGKHAKLEDGKIKDVDITKEYFCLPGKKKEIKITSGQESEILVLAYDRIPLFEFKVRYNITNLLNVVDMINQKTSWLKNIDEKHGNALLELPGKIELSPDSKDNDGGKAVINPNQTNGMIRFVEMQGHIAKQMREDVKELKAQVLEEYPEYGLSRLLSGSNKAAETSKIQLTEIINKIDEIRTSFGEELKNLFLFLVKYEGKSVSELLLDFGEIINFETTDAKLAKTEKEMALLHKLLKLRSYLLYEYYKSKHNLPELDEKEFDSMADEVFGENDNL